MRWYSEFKAKRAAKAALNAHNTALSIWQDDLATLEKIIAVFTVANDGVDAVSNTLMQKPGERTIWSATGIFHEVGRTPSRYAGGSGGVSVPVGAGIRLRVGAMRGQVIPGEELQMDKDQGVVMLTTERLIFTGPLKTQEWNFDKILMISTTPDESDYFINVSNRQKTSGVRFDAITGREFNRFLGSATAAHELGFGALLNELAELKREALAEQPSLQLPATPPKEIN